VAETKAPPSRSRGPSSRSRGTVTTSEVNVQPVSQANTGDTGGGIKGTIKKHPYATSAVAALGLSAAYLIYKHFKSSSSTAATTTGATTSGFPLNTGSGTRRGGGAQGIGSGGGSGSGGGNGSSTGSTGGGTTGGTDLTGLFTGLQQEIGLLGQEISALGSTSSTGGSQGGAISALPYSALPGVQPANTLPASAKTVNVQVGSGTYAVPYTGATPSPVITTLLGQTAAANAGIPTNGITASDIAAAKSSVAAGAGQQAPQTPGGVVKPSPAPSKAVAAAPATSTNQHVSSSTPTTSSAAPKAGTATNTQAAHAQQVAQTAPRTTVGHATLTKG
jgi:hypothetical protein